MLTLYKNVYQACSCSTFGKSDHALVLLLPAYWQRLKWEQPVTCTVWSWTDQPDADSRHSFCTMVWDVFRIAANNNINSYTDVSKCINDIVPQVTVWTYPNQKPCINGEIHSALRVQTAAFKSKDPDEYRKARYELRKSITQYRGKVDGVMLQWFQHQAPVEWAKDHHRL